MERYIAVDSGKYATKAAVYAPDSEKEVLFQKFSTKTGPGDFRDDMLESGTILSEINGKVYKIGRGARMEAEMETSKATETHRLCVLTAIALNCSDGETDEVHAAAGIPLTEWENIDKRIAYKNFILPEGEITVRLVRKSGEMPSVKKFRIVSRYVFPETMGALFLQDVFPYTNDSVGVIDIGGLNVNGAVWSGRDVDHSSCFTNESGGNHLMSDLAQELSAAFSRCNVNYVAKMLKTFHGKDRCLRLTGGTPERKKEVEEQSRQMVGQHLKDYVSQVRSSCNAKQWPVDYIPLVFIGGTCDLLRDEIQAVFGDQTIIPDRPEYANAAGFLRVLLGKDLGIVIDV